MPVMPLTKCFTYPMLQTKWVFTSPSLRSSSWTTPSAKSSPTTPLKFKSKLKHIDTRQEWVQVLRNKDILVPEHVDTKLNIADIFTTILSVQDFTFLRGLIMMIHTVANK